MCFFSLSLFIKKKYLFKNVIQLVILCQWGKKKNQISSEGVLYIRYAFPKVNMIGLGSDNPS